jgi:hypothetical protein
VSDKGKVIPGGCPCGFWAASNCQYVIARGMCHRVNEDPRMFAIARKVTDEVLGAGTYDELNHPSKIEKADQGDRLLAEDQTHD